MRTRSPRALFLLLPIAMMTLLTCSSQRPSQAENKTLFRPAPGSPFPAAPEAGRVAIADVNGDGEPDIVYAGKDGLGLLLGDGSGSFRAGKTFPVTARTHLVAAADFNGDGRIDLAASSHDSNDVFLLLGNGAGDFAPALGSPFAAMQGKPHNHGLVAGDVNGDGKPDITFGHQENGSIAVLLGDGKGGLKAASGSPFHIGRGFYPHAVADVDGDGKLDIIAPDLLANAVVVARGDGKGSFAVTQTIPVRERPYFVAVADLDHNGRQDIVVTHDDISEVWLLLQDFAGKFSHKTLDVGERPGHAAVADFDRDGHLDIAFATGHGASVFLGDGKGGFRAAPGSPFRGGQWDIEAADVNGDGRMDLILPDFDAGKIAVFLGQ